MKRAYCVIIRACSVSFLAGHSGALIIGLALVGTASLAGPAWGQWTTGSGGTIYYNGGNVGIGTTNPANLFSIFSPTGSGDPIPVFTISNQGSPNNFYVFDGGEAFINNSSGKATPALKIISSAGAPALQTPPSGLETKAPTTLSGMMCRM